MTHRFPLRLAAAIGILLAALVLIAAPSSGHPGDTDPTGGHKCKKDDAEAGVCPRDTYHRHGPNGSMVIVAEPTQAQRQAARAASGGTAAQANPSAAPTSAPAAPGVPPPTAAAAPGTAPGLAATGPSSVVVALSLIGVVLLVLGGGAIGSARLVPAPALVEWKRPFSG